MRAAIPPEKAYRLINHGPCPLLTTGDGTRRNVAPINWTLPVQDDPPLVLIAVEPGNYTDELLRASGEFVVNVVGEEWVPAILFCGGRSGRETDKFQEAGIGTAPSRTVKPPRLDGSIGHLECRVEDVRDFSGVRLYIGRVLHAEADDEFFREGRLLPGRARTPHHLGGGVFAVTERAIESPRGGGPAPRPRDAGTPAENP